MSIVSLLDSSWKRRPGATAEQIAAVEAALSIALPGDVRELLLWSDGGEGRIGNHELTLWSTAEIPVLNKKHQIPAYLPEVYGIGAGQDVYYALDYRGGGAPPVVEVPTGDTDPDMVAERGPTLEACLLSWSRG